MQFYEIIIFQVMILRFYAVYNKHEIIEIDNETKKKIASIVTSARIILLPTVMSYFPREK